MAFDWLEWLGYLASLIVLISLLMSSIIKLRWVNLIGSAIFALYGFLIGALPVGFMNLGIVLINVYYLYKIYNSKEYFKLLPIENDSPYVQHFLDFYESGIEKYFSLSEVDPIKSEVKLFILRNMVPAGLFIAKRHNEHTLEIMLDFVIPEYRDFKIGSFIYESSKTYFLSQGYTIFISYSSNPDHINYLKKMGFVEDTDEKGKKYYTKTI
ncbi:hypothetical protein RZN22_14290 [Bacillaceae bacterium S4-13-58]